MNWPSAWISDSLVTSIRDWPRPGTGVAMEPDASTTVVSRALCTVMVHIPSVSSSSFAEGASAAGVAYGWGFLPPAAATRESFALPSPARNPCSAKTARASRSPSRVMKRSAARDSATLRPASLTRVYG